MSDYCNQSKAKQDAEWLAGSEADNAERNLARAYLAIRAEVASLREELEVNAKILANRERECIALRERLAALLGARSYKVTTTGGDTFRFTTSAAARARPDGEGRDPQPARLPGNEP